MNNLKLNIEYIDFIKMCYGLEKKLVPLIDYNKISGVIAVLRGGMYIADYLARKFNLPLYYYEVSSYNGQKQGEFIEGIKSFIPEGHYLLCDDIYDTGKTVQHIYNKYPDCTFTTATLISKQDTDDILYQKLVEPETWIVFPWEVE